MALFKNKMSVVFLSFLLLCSCSKNANDGSPKAVLAAYVKESMNINSSKDKTKLLEMTSGEAKHALEGLDEDSFKKLFIDSHREFTSLKIKDERELTPERYSITYELSYKVKSPNSDDSITIKKHAILVREGSSNKWLISEVQNLKTNIEHQNAMSF